MRKGLWSARYWLLLSVLLTACQRTLYWDTTARGSLRDAQGTCYQPVLHGSFRTGISPGSDTAFVEIMVNVFTPGHYLIHSDLENGLTFAAEGSFTSIGLQSVRLKPSGKPERKGPTNFSTSFDTSHCGFLVDVQDTTTAPVLNTWRYTDTESNHVYEGTINATQYLVSPLSTLVSLRHEVANPSDTSFDLTIVFPNGVTTGAYTTDVINNVALSARGVCINCAWNVAYQFYGAITTIVVSDYDPQTRIIRGTFSGTTINGDNEVLPIKKGEFFAEVK